MYQIDWDKYLIATRERQSTTGNYDATGADKRNAFESDLGRVYFSSALRRMHDKTQVIPLTTGDYIHTRLTHSIEVMNIAESIANNLTRHPEFVELYGKEKAFEYEKSISAILRTASIIHDIGNPPFGHFGEDTIKNYFVSDCGKKYLEGVDNAKQLDFTQFDGNAQGLRVLSKLQYLGDTYGLNLTYGTLGAYIKYPNYGPAKKDVYIGLKKHGVFASEAAVLDHLAEKCSMTCEHGFKRHPLVFIMEAADSICYDIMDLEDALTLGWIDFEKMLADVSSVMSKKSGREIKIEDLVGFQFNNELPLKKNIVNFRVKVIRYMVDLATRNFINNLEGIDRGTYNKELIEDDEYHLAKSLSDYACKDFFTNRNIVSAELTGESVLTGLLNIVLRYVFSENDGYRNRIKGVISENVIRLNYLENKQTNGALTADPVLCPMSQIDLKNMDPYNKLKLVVDWISGMTDKYALDIYQKLSGASL